MIVLIGVGVGLLYGVFGAGGSAFATPLLALAGVPAIAAVASPLPATIPAALTGAWAHRRQTPLAGSLVLRCVAVGFPAAIAGALASGVVPGAALLVLSGLLLLLVGARLLAPVPLGEPRSHPRAVVGAAAGVGFAAGLLANSGGFLLVPLFVLLAGSGMHQAARSSLVVATVLSVPTLATHWALGHIDWSVALLFGAGLVPATLAGARIAGTIRSARLQHAFGAVLVVFAAWFLVRLAR